MELRLSPQAEIEVLKLSFGSLSPSFYTCQHGPEPSENQKQENQLPRRGKADAFKYTLSPPNPWRASRGPAASVSSPAGADVFRGFLSRHPFFLAADVPLDR